jgi:archaemetzincin
MARLDDYNLNDSLYKRCRQRTMNVAVHETGHIFGIKHCVQNECCMNGSNSLSESDRQPTWLCWECLAKVCLNRNTYPVNHISELLAFHTHVTQDKKQIEYYSTALRLLKQ